MPERTGLNRRRTRGSDPHSDWLSRVSYSEAEPFATLQPVLNRPRMAVKTFARDTAQPRDAQSTHEPPSTRKPQLAGSRRSSYVKAGGRLSPAGPGRSW